MQHHDSHRDCATDIGAMVESISIVDNCDDATVARLVFEIGSIANQMFSTVGAPEDYFVKTLNGRFRQQILERILFVAMKRIAPTLQVGCDFSEEFREANVVLERDPA
jgi:hypothetical protein